MSTIQDRLITSLQSLESIVAKYDDICDSAIRNELKTDGFYNSKQIIDHLATLQEESRNLKIGIIGRVKAGKSSLINALLFDGKEVLPKAATPMTAALTSIGYAKEFTAKVRFFGVDDIEQLRAKAEEFDSEVIRRIKIYREEIAERQKNSIRPIPEIDDQKLRAKAIREIGEDGVLCAAADLYSRIKASDVDINVLGEHRQLKADSAEALNTQLMDYVGSSGRFMPFTRELNLGLPLDSLKGIEVLDTPGVNDPVKSREQRTYERLKECNAAFIVSPAGQFMSEQDFELADRLSTREGTQEIFIVASQADTQLHSSIRKDAQGILPVAVDQLRTTMAQQAGRALSQCENEVLKRIATEQSKRLILTSGVCETLILGKGESQDTTAAHAIKLLKDSYPDYFARPEDMIANLTLLSGRESLERAIESVRQKKTHILEQQASHFIDAQWQTFMKVKESVINRLAERRNDVESGDKAQIEERLKALQQASSKAVAAADNEFINQVEDMRLRLPAELGMVIQRAIDVVDEKTESAEGSEQQTRRVEKGGALSWLGRKLGLGGYESRTYKVATLQPLPVRRALENLSKLIRNGLKDCATQNMLHWRVALISGLSRQLRETVGDENVDITQLQSVCRSVVNRIVDFPEIEIPELPAELAKSRKIEGYGVDDFVEAAHEYVDVLEKAGLRFIDEVRNSISSMLDNKIGSELLSDLVIEMENLQQMIENKRLTIEKMSRMHAELRDV